MTALRELNCSYCPKLKTLPAGMAALQTLGCSNCKLLQALPVGMAALQMLSCRSCKQLQVLPAGMAALRNLDCGSYENLQAISVEDMPSLRYIYCDLCPSLVEVPIETPTLRVVTMPRYLE